MAIVRVEAQTSVSSSLTVTFSTPTTGGELIVVGWSEGVSGGLGTVTDDHGQTYTLALQSGVFLTHYTVQVWYVQNSVAGVTTITVTMGSGDIANALGIVAAHYTGVATTGALDQAAAPTGSATTPWSSPSITTTSNNEVLFGFLFNFVSTGSPIAPTPDAGWSSLLTYNDNNGNMVGFADQIVAGTGTYQFSGTGNANNNVFASISSFEGIVIPPSNYCVEEYGLVYGVRKAW